MLNLALPKVNLSWGFTPNPTLAARQGCNYLATLKIALGRFQHVKAKPYGRAMRGLDMLPAQMKMNWIFKQVFKKE